MSREATLEDLNKVWEINVLSKMKDSDKAKALLERIAHEVASLMKRRKWKVLKLNEFFPNNPSLQGLNVNRGESIMLRMRPPNNAESLYPYEHVMGTMIHELTHMQIGPHDSSFYKLMEEIENELNNDLMNHISNNSSVSFTGKVQRLGGKFEGNVSKEKLSIVMAEAALRREKHILLVSGSGQKLGGSVKNNITFSPAELKKRAAAAAERRLQDDKWCPSNQINHRNDGTKQQQQQQQSNASNVINNQETHSRNNTSSSSKNSSLVSTNISNWICELCTTSNPSHSIACHFCESANPLQDLWTCQICTLINRAVICACEVCGNSPSKSSMSSDSYYPENIVNGNESKLPHNKVVEIDLTNENTITISNLMTSNSRDNNNNNNNNNNNVPMVVDLDNNDVVIVHKSESPQRKRMTTTTTNNNINDNNSLPTQTSTTTNINLEYNDTKDIAKVTDKQVDMYFIPCKICTYLNTTTAATRCVMCGSDLIFDHKNEFETKQSNITTTTYNNNASTATATTATATTTTPIQTAWTCDYCTLLNDSSSSSDSSPSVPQCAACGLPKKIPPSVAAPVLHRGSSSSYRDSRASQNNNFIFNPYKPMFH